MVSSHIDSIFTNFTLQETIYLSVELLLNDKPTIDALTITDFNELLTIIMS